MRELVGGKNTIGRTAAMLKSPIKRPLPLPLRLICPCVCNNLGSHQADFQYNTLIVRLCLQTDNYSIILLQHNGMAPIKFDACQAHSINQYRNIRTKIIKCCANIYFNQQCLIRKVIPNYAKFKIPYTYPASQVTQKKIHIIRIKNKIKFLHKKNRNLTGICITSI